MTAPSITLTTAPIPIINIGIKTSHRPDDVDVVVVDDVMTSGSTLNAVGRAIRAAEPASLAAIVVAVADPRGRGFDGI